MHYGDYSFIYSSISQALANRCSHWFLPLSVTCAAEKCELKIKIDPEEFNKRDRRKSKRQSLLPRDRHCFVGFISAVLPALLPVLLETT